jgi:hypothetical protein
VRAGTFSEGQLGEASSLLVWALIRSLENPYKARFRVGRLRMMTMLMCRDENAPLAVTYMTTFEIRQRKGWQCLEAAGVARYSTEATRNAALAGDLP